MNLSLEAKRLVKSKLADLANVSVGLLRLKLVNLMNEDSIQV